MGDEIAGRVAVRHALNEYLLRAGGHIGYGVIPEFRGKGIAGELLRAGLAEARRVGVDRVLVTCDHDNPASARVIEKAGGKLENVLELPAEGRKVHRYWFSH